MSVEAIPESENGEPSLILNQIPNERIAHGFTVTVRFPTVEFQETFITETRKANHVWIQAFTRAIEELPSLFLIPFVGAQQKSPKLLTFE